MIGFLNIYKPSGMTSNFVVQKVKKILKCKKVGHMGTLDPMACGILPIAIGKATRLFDYSLSKTKTYEAIFDFGYTTDTLDITGSIIDRNDIQVSSDDIYKVLPSFIGKIEQMPPKYSAKNINGKRAYTLAREGVEFELQPKQIEIYELDLIEQVENNRFKFKIKCSSGTYIRSIARDIAYALGTFGCMSFLERTSTGIFDLSTSITLEQLECDKFNSLLSPIDAFPNFSIINITRELCVDLKNGKKINYSKILDNSFIVCDDKVIGIVKPSDGYLKLDTYLEEEDYD